MDYTEAPVNNSPRNKRSLKELTFALFVGLPAVVFWIMIGSITFGLMALLGDDDDYCNVVKIPVHGVIVTDDGGFGDLFGFGALTGAASVVQAIRDADEDEMVEALLLDIDSPGGTPVAADAIMTALSNSSKPTVALIQDVGASAAYWVAAGADHIVASPVSSVGSIGVTMSYTEEAGITTEEGGRFIEISSGSFKDAGNPERVLTAEEQAYYQEQVDIAHGYFVDRVAEVRPTLTRDAYARLADGRIFIGVQAFKEKLVDALGGADVALSYLADMTGMAQDDIVVCTAEGDALHALLQ